MPNPSTQETPGSIINHEICNRCLINMDARTVIRATWKAGGLDHIEICPVPVSPVELIRWVEARWYGDNARFQVDATTDRFKAISTWNGDPVCVVHLWTLVDLEMKRGYR